MAPYYDDDDETVQSRDHQQTIPTEHDRLLADRGHDSLYRTLSVRFIPNETVSDRHAEATVDGGIIGLDNIHLQTLVLTYRSAEAMQNSFHKMTAMLRYQDKSLSVVARKVPGQRCQSYS